jgi:hypothetical protein
MRVHVPKIVGIIITLAIGLVVCGCKPSREERMIRAGYDATVAAPVIKLEHKTHRFEFKGHAFEFLPPVGFVFSEFITPFGKEFTLKGPKVADSSTTSFIISIILPTPLIPDTVEPVIDAILAPYHKRLANYSRIDKRPFTNNGLVYESSTFSGQLGPYTLNGIVLGTSKNNALFIIKALKNGQQIDRFETEFFDFFKSFKVLS